MRIALVTLAGVLVLGAGLVLRDKLSDGGGTRQLDDLVRTLEQRVVENPQDLNARLSIGAAYLERGLAEEAVVQFQEALKLAPNDITAQIGLGRSLRASGEPQLAAEALTKVLELTKDDPLRDTSDQLQTVFYELGQIYMEGDNAAGAVEQLKEAVRINPGDADSWFALGSAYRRAGNTEAAEAAYLRSVALVPDYVEVYSEMVGLYEDSGRTGRRLYAEGMLALASEDFPAAAETLAAAADAEPDFAVIHEALGMVREGLGDKPGALAAYQRALELDPTLFLSGLAVERLGQ